MKVELAFISLSLLSFVAVAEVRPASLFCDGMVLQRDRPVAVWGTANAGERVEVEFAGQSARGMTDSRGRWEITLLPLKASSLPREMRVNRTVIRDVLVGEVWFASGQSNMEVPIWGSEQGRGARFRDRQGGLILQYVNCPNIRFFNAADYSWSVEPRIRHDSKWVPFTGENLRRANFSAVAFYFAMELERTLRIPVGIVAAYWGGTSIIPWIPRTEFAKHAEFGEFATRRLVTPEEAKAKKLQWKHGQPSVIWNAQVAPLAPYAMRGVIWYQGCSDVERADRYLALQHAFYDGWSNAFRNPSMDMLFVQICPMVNRDFSPIQLSQSKFAAEEPRAAMAVIHDVSNAYDIHPNDKEIVGRRLAALALKRDYGYANLRVESPVLRAWKVEADCIVLTFDHARSWYVYNRDTDIHDVGRASFVPFEIAGADGVFMPARLENVVVAKDSLGKPCSYGRVEGPELRVVAESVKEPRRLRYLFAAPRRDGLFNEVGLPLGIFEIDVGSGKTISEGSRAKHD